jgi:hypothetical protein
MITFDMISFFPQGGEGGIQGLVALNNGYTVSIVRNKDSYGGKNGLYEMAFFVGKEIVEEHPLLDDHGVLGWLDEKEVEIVISKLRRYKVKKSCLSAQ